MLKRSFQKGQKVCVCVCVYYNTTLAFEDTHATSTSYWSTQSLEEHFIMEHMLFEPQQ